MSDERIGPALRLARGVVAGSVAVGLGSAAHLAAGGLLPSVTSFVLIVSVVAGVAIVSMGVPVGLRRMVGLVGGGQFATHLMLTATAGHAGDPVATRIPAAPMRDLLADVGADRRGSLYDLTMGPGEPPMGSEFVMPHWLTHVVADLSGPQAAMAVAHFAAAALVAWWLAQGERALWTVVALLGTSVVRALRRLTAMHDVQPSFARPPSTPHVHVQRPCRLLAPLTGGLGRRGPPLTAI